MVKIKMLSTGEYREVTPNVAHGLVENGEAEIVKAVYSHRQMTTTRVSMMGSKKKSSKRTSKTYKSKA